MTVSELSLLGDKALGFTQYAQIKDIDFDTKSREVDPHQDDERKDPDDVIFDEIFSVDPVTKLPNGDIACFMNENTSESVRNFIIQNLTKDSGEVSDGVDVGALDDDTIAQFTRNADESSSQYRDRLISYFKDSYSKRSKADE